MKRIATGVVAAIVIGAVTAGPASAAKAKPKLEVTKLGTPPGQVAPDSSLRVIGRVANFGRMQGLARVRIYISPNRSPQAGSLIGSIRVRVRAKSSARFTVPARLPGAGKLKPGTYHLIACTQKQGITGAVKCERPARTTSVPSTDLPPAGGGTTNPGGNPGPGTPTEPTPEPPVFTPGAKTVGDPIYPQLGNGGYDALNYDIDLTYDPVANTFGAAGTEMTAKATQNLSQLSMDFQLDVNSVTVNGAAATFTQEDATPDVSANPAHSQPRKLVITPAVGILKDTDFDVNVDFSGKQPQVYTDPDDAIEGWIPACYTPTALPQVCDSYYVVGEPVGSQAWFPSNNHASDKASVDTSITVPNGQTAVGVGELTEAPIDNGNGTTTWSWSENQAIAPYLATASNGTFNYSVSSMLETLTGRTLPLYFAVDPSGTVLDQTNITNTLARTESVMNYYAANYGPYPFDSNGAVVERSTGIGYALEVNGKSHYPGNNSRPGVGATTQAHEIAHQWFGNNVAPATWADLWFNEGWAEWSTYLWDHEENGNPDTPADIWQELYDDPGNDWSVAPAVLDGDPAKLFFPSFPTYERGAMTIEGYKQIVGDTKFFTLAKRVQSEFGGKTITTRQFIAVALEESGLSGAQLDLLEDYFEQWLYGTSKPTITAASF